nr:piggyBac transposable element-derived protein 4-like [Nomia melanderi]
MDNYLIVKKKVTVKIVNLILHLKNGYGKTSKTIAKFGSQDTVKNSITSASENVTMFMCTPISNFRHTLFLDNWYSSPNLFQKLQSIKTNAIVTVRYNRKNMPKDLATIKLKRSEAISRSCKCILAAKWKDKKAIYLLSKKHKKIEMMEVEKKRWKTNNIVTKPNIVLEYNDGMDVAQQILESVCMLEYTKRGRLYAGDIPLRLQSKHWGHFPRNIPPTEAKKNSQRRCKVCAKHKKCSETTWECKKCLVALDIPKCFEIYHTEERKHILVMTLASPISDKGKYEPPLD